MGLLVGNINERVVSVLTSLDYARPKLKKFLTNSTNLTNLTNLNVMSFNKFLHQFCLTDYKLSVLYDRFCAEIRKGLGRNTNADADTKCFVTYVQDLPTGDETGKFLALDLGGSRFRVLMVELKGSHEAELHSDVYDLTDELMLGPGTQLFDHIAACLHDFVEKMGVRDMNLPLGFTFSFPCTQEGLTKALLARWTKGFNCSGVVNEDVGRLLHEAIVRRKDLKIDMVAVLNDTTGTLMSCAHRNTNCRIGLIVGTGCNACYVERVENVERMSEEHKNKPYVIINVELGAFGERGALDIVRTEFDVAIDEHSINKGAQIFEKMVSGMYLGEMVRLALLGAIKENLIFNDCSYKQRIADFLANNKGCIESRVLSEVDKDNDWTNQKTRWNLSEIFQLKEAISNEDCKKFKAICDAIAKRAGMLTGVVLSGLLNKMNFPHATVGVDGSVYIYHERFDEYMREAMDKLVDKSIKYDIMLSEDGSGRGAALVAAVVSKG